jgi:hypothetical protein
MGEAVTILSQAEFNDLVAAIAGLLAAAFVIRTLKRLF